MDLIHRYVWDEAGFSFRDDGLYVVDFGWEWKVGPWSEVC